MTKEDICIQRKEEWRKRPTKKHLVQRKFDKQKSSSTYRQTCRVLSYHDTKTGEAWTSKVKVWVRWQLCPSIMVSLNKWTPKRTCLDVQVFHCVVKICWLLVTRNGHIRKLLLPSFIVFDDVYENCGLLARYKKNFWVMNIHVYLYFPSVIILNVIHMFS